MTDMRATERLLEVVQEKAIDIRDFDNVDSQKFAGEIVVMLTELRRRGDTLVRGEDLRLVAEARQRHLLTNSEQAEVDAAWQRLQNALGGTL